MSGKYGKGLLSKFSSAILDIQQLAQNQPNEHFHDRMLERLQLLIPFDKAWWGRAALINGMPEEHRSHLFNLPSSYLVDWQSIQHDDITIARAYSAPGRAVIIDMNSTPGLSWLGNTHDIREWICVLVIDPITHLSEHLTLYRSARLTSFNDDDCMLLDNLMPHLAAAVSANQIRTLIAMRETLSDTHNLALAVCDQRGTLQCAERGFIELLLNGWPQWNGPTLPIPIKAGVHDFGHLHLNISRVGDLFVLTGRVHNALQLLSPREYEVALGFGDGKTYKEVARDLGLAPNTVRHHIRTIYSKLGVKDKARIAQLLRTSPD